MASRSDPLNSADPLDKAGYVSFIQWTDLIKQVMSVLFSGLFSGGLT